jgi:hypothetical protein
MASKIDILAFLDDKFAKTEKKNKKKKKSKTKPEPVETIKATVTPILDALK